jgi:hypothetical protein
MSYENLKNKYKNQAFPESMISREVPSHHRDLIFEQGDSFNESKLKDSKNISKSNKGDSFYMDDNYYKKTKTPLPTHKNFGNKNNDWKPKNYNGAAVSNNNSNYAYNSQNFNQYQNYPLTNNQNQQGKNIKEYLNHLEMSVADNFSVEQSYIRHEKNPKVYDSVYFSMCQDKDKENSYYPNQDNSYNDNHPDPDHPDTHPDQGLNKTIFTSELKDQIDNIPTRTTEYNKDENYNFKQTGTKINSFTPVNIKLIYKINEKLKFPRNDPLWYIYHIHSKSSFGPVSSSQVEEMYNMKHIDGQTEIRFIDIFKIKGKGPFAFFRLKEIENQNLLRDLIDPSNLIVQVPIKTNVPSVIDEEFMNVKKEEVVESKDPFKKKGKKKVKGKPVDLDIKTGFFTVSQQEKNYEPIYICGEKDD